MYPLLLKAPVKEYVWGGTKLTTEFGLEASGEIAAEAWMLSAHKDGMNTVRNGEHAGKTICEVLKIWGETVLGKSAERFPYFPILVKLIDAKQKLSVQVHPDNAYALSVEGEYGKTEMWYVVDCEDGASLIYGFKQPLSKEEFRERIENDTLTEVCNIVPVHKGDVFFVPAGTLHAIGAGVLIAEVQQNSNVTYRVSDYGRTGADGKPRELHVAKALDVTNCEMPTTPYGNIGERTSIGNNTVRELATCEQFSAKLLTLKETLRLCLPDSFLSLVVLDGNATLCWDGGELTVKKGDSVFVPAGLKIELCGSAEILYSHV